MMARGRPELGVHSATLLLLLLLLLPMLVRSASGAVCSSDLGCSLNGRCVGGRCQCDAAWRGPRCGELALLPAASQNGYGGPGSNVSSWGGGAAFDPVTGKFIMVVSEFDRHCGLASYHHNSRCVLAEAHRAAGPYAAVAVLVAANCMGTVAARDPQTGAWLFSGYHVNQSECLLCSGGVTPDLPKHADGKSGACSPPGPGTVDTKNALLARNSPRGPWRDAGSGVPNVGADVQPFFSANGSFFISEGMNYPGTSSCCVNHPNGTTSGNEWCDHATDGNSTSFVSLRVAASLADGLAGRWSNNLVQSWTAADRPGSYAPCFNWEDSTFWVDPRGYHLLFHAFTGRPCDYPRGGCHGDNISAANRSVDCQALGGHAFSEDARHWYISPDAAYGPIVEYEDGSRLHFRAR